MDTPLKSPPFAPVGLSPLNPVLNVKNRFNNLRPEIAPVLLTLDPGFHLLTRSKRPRGIKERYGWLPLMNQQLTHLGFGSFFINRPLLIQLQHRPEVHEGIRLHRLTVIVVIHCFNWVSD